MAELAFETIVRIFIALIMLAMLSIITTTILKDVEKNVSSTIKKDIILPVVLNAEGFSTSDVSLYIETCKEYYHHNTPDSNIEECYILKGVKLRVLDELSANGKVLVMKKSSNAIISYRAYDDKVIIE